MVILGVGGDYRGVKLKISCELGTRDSEQERHWKREGLWMMNRHHPKARLIQTRSRPNNDTLTLTRREIRHVAALMTSGCVGWPGSTAS